MPMYDAVGNEIAGAMSAEEVEAKVAEATTAITTELADAKTRLEATTKQLEGLSDKDKNFGTLRQLADTQAKTIAELSGKIDSVKTEVLNSVTAKTREDLIRSLADGDADVEAKIRVQYERLIKLEPSIDDATIAKVAADAYRLSVETVKPSVLNRVISGKPMGGPATEDRSIPQEVLDAAPAFGLTPEDIKKHGGPR